MPENGQTSSNLFLSLFCFGPGLHWYQRYRPLHITCLYTGPGRGKREELWSGTQSTHIYSTRFSSQFRNSNHLPLNETEIFKIWSESFEYPPISLISISRTFSNESVFFSPISHTYFNGQRWTRTWDICTIATEPGTKSRWIFRGRKKKSTGPNKLDLDGFWTWSRVSFTIFWVYMLVVALPPNKQWHWSRKGALISDSVSNAKLVMTTMFKLSQKLPSACTIVIDCVDGMPILTSKDLGV